RELYHSLLTAFHRGRIVTNWASSIEVQGKLIPPIGFGPNLAMIPNVSKAYERAIELEPDMRDHIGSAHKNFIRDAVYFLISHNRERDANSWFKYGEERYGTNAFPGAANAMQYALMRIGEDV